MTSTHDWTDLILQYGEARNWSPLGKRAFKRFRTYAALGGREVHPGFAAANAFATAYAALAWASSRRRAEIRTWADVKALIAERAAADEAKRRAQAEAIAAWRERFISEHCHERCWTIARTVPTEFGPVVYTYHELRRWLDWARGYLYGAPETGDLYAVYIARPDAEPVWVADWSLEVEGIEFERQPFSFERALADLELYAHERFGHPSTTA